jgi:hypothetical protein
MGHDKDADRIDPTAGCRDGYLLECPHSDCHGYYTGDDLAAIAKSAADHWNKKHGDDLKRRYDALDEVVTGGHHIQGNAYEVRKYKVYITAFDVMKNIGEIDGRLVRGDNTKTCRECLCRIPDPEERIEEEPDSVFNDEWTCSECLDEQEIERRAEQNRDLTEFTA